MNRNLSYKLALSLVLSGLIWSGNVGYAQNFNPGSTNPGLLAPASPTEQTQEREQQRLQKTIPTEQETSPETQFDAPAPSASVQIDTPRFTVNDIVVENAAIIDQQQLDALTSQYEGKEITLDDLEQLVDQINNLYREKGYLTSQAYVPPQDVQQGVVRIQVMEGKVGKVYVSGNRFYRTNAILRQLSLDPGQPFNIRDLEQELNRSNKFNNYRLKATLSPGENPGETDVKLNVSERQPWQISPTFDNQGRPGIGMYRGGVELTNDSLFGYGDRLTTRFIGASGTAVGLGSYFVPLNGRGDEIGISYGISHVDVDLPGVPNDIDGTAHNLGFIFSHPFDEERRWIGDIGINGRRIINRLDGVTTNADDIRSIQAGLNYDNTDRIGRTFLRLQTSVGLGFLGGEHSFWKGEAFLNRIFRLSENNTLLIRAYGQITPNALPIAEAFQIGGAYSVRGYNEGFLIGDRGYNISIEDRFPLPFLRAISPWLAERLQGAAFFDIGQVWIDSDNDRFVGISALNDDNLLMGAGVGLRARLSQYLQGFVDFGFGLINHDDREGLGQGQPTMRIHFGVRSNLLAEDYRTRSNRTTTLNERGKVVTVSDSTTTDNMNLDGQTNIAPEGSMAPTVEPTTTSPAESSMFTPQGSESMMLSPAPGESATEPAMMGQE